MGGPGYIEAIKVPLHQILLNATGGVNLENAGEFIKAGASIISVGSALVDKKAVMRKNWGVNNESQRVYRRDTKG